MTDLPKAIIYGHGEILTPTLNQLDVMSRLLNLIPLYIFLIYDVFFNKALHEFNNNNNNYLAS
jgi:hypothetical protein